MMSKIKNIHNSAGWDSVGSMSFGSGPFAFCLPLKPMQSLEVTQASCNLEDEIHIVSMNENEDRSLDSQWCCWDTILVLYCLPLNFLLLELNKPLSFWAIKIAFFWSMTYIQKHALQIYSMMNFLKADIYVDMHDINMSFRRHVIYVHQEKKHHSNRLPITPTSFRNQYLKVTQIRFACF